MNYIEPSLTYEEQLFAYFSGNRDLVEQALNPLFAPNGDDPSVVTPYVRINEGASKPVLYVPGFCEGVVNKLPFAIALAAEGYDVILPGQSRRRAVKSTPWGAGIATQARDSLAVLEHASAREFDLAAHSFGALAAQAIAEGAKPMHDTSDTSVVLLAPAGVGTESSYFALGKRWLRFQRSEWGTANKAVPDTTGETGRASVRTMFANLGLSAAELVALRYNRVDFHELCALVGSVAVVCYADDEMFPQKHLQPGIQTAIEAGAYAFSPLSFETTAGALRRSPGAVHDDEQFNPHRVVRAIMPFLSR